MTYRDDRDADQARIAALEGELAAAKQRIGELEGKQSTALVRAGGGALAMGAPSSRAATRWLGAPVRLELSRRFDAAFPIDKFEDLIDTIREATRDRGRVELLRSSMAWWASSSDRGTGPFTCVTVTVKDGATTLSVTDRLGQLAGGLFGGLGGGLGGGGIAAPLFASFAVPVLAPVFFVGWFGGVYGLTRTIYKRAAKRRALALQSLFDLLEAEISKTLRG